MANNPKPQSKNQAMNEFNILGKLVIGLAFVLLLSVSFYAVIFLIFGMLPTFMASSIDKRSGKFASRTIGAFNFTGTVPFLIDIWVSSDPFNTIKDIVMDPVVWIIVYGSAGFGWFMIWIMPQIVSVAFTTQADIKIHKLHFDRDKLVEEWGDEITYYTTRSKRKIEVQKSDTE